VSIAINSTNKLEG